MTHYPHKPLGETFEEKVKRIVAAKKLAMQEQLQRVQKQRAIARALKRKERRS